MLLVFNLGCAGMTNLEIFPGIDTTVGKNDDGDLEFKVTLEACELAEVARGFAPFIRAAMSIFGKDCSKPEPTVATVAPMPEK